jgi:hypothetical protein
MLAVRDASVLPVQGLDRNRPFVIANSLIAAEANYYEPPSVLKTVFYLFDTKSSLKYTGATVVENEFRRLQRVGAARLNFDEYREFIQKNDRFYVYGPLEYVDDWLVKKLVDDGANVRLVRRAWVPSNPTIASYIRDAYILDVTVTKRTSQ